MLISRRTLFAAPLLGLARPAEASPAWIARLLKGRFNGESYEGGLHVSLAPGWKTYWRVPGAGGIPPEISAAGSNLRGFAFSCPLPSRFAGSDGETIGYQDEVVFPFTATPQDLSQPLEIAIKAFIGVCETICIPAKYESAILYSPISSELGDDAALRNWTSKVPRSGRSVRAVSVTEIEGKPFAAITLDAPASDIFIEGQPEHYFNAPLWQVPGLEALIAVDGAKGMDELRGVSLRITLATSSGGLEQTVEVV